MKTNRYTIDNSALNPIIWRPGSRNRNTSNTETNSLDGLDLWGELLK